MCAHLLGKQEARVRGARDLKELGVRMAAIKEPIADDARVREQVVDGGSGPRQHAAFVLCDLAAPRLSGMIGESRATR